MRRKALKVNGRAVTRRPRAISRPLKAKLSKTLRIVEWPIRRLKPYAANARTHSDAQVDQLVSLIKEFGWTVPILITPDGTIAAGHGRLLAAQKLNMKSVPVIVRESWTEAQRRAYTLADNKVPLNAGWDSKLLALELTSLQSLGALEFSGFSLSEFEQLTFKPGDKSTDKQASQFIPEAWDVLVSCAGELSQRELLDQLTEKGYKCRALVR